MAKKESFRSALIFGGAGFIGSNWAQALLERTEAKVHVFDNLSRPGSRHNLQFLQNFSGRSGRLQITIGDVRDSAMVHRAVKHATEIYNFAAQVAVTTSVLDPRLDFEVNVGGTFNILEAARKSAANPFILFTSTNKVYGNLADNAIPQGKRYVSEASCGTTEEQPLNFHSPYGCSKGAADQYVRDYARIYGLPTVVFRMSCVAGPRQFGNEDQGWLAHFLYSALLGNRITIYGSGMQVRDVLYIGDLLRAFESAREHISVTRGQVYNIGGGPSNTVSLLELIDMVEEMTGVRLECDRHDIRPGDQPVYVSNHSRFMSHTGWQPQVGVQAVIEKIYAWFRSNRECFTPSRMAALPVLPPVLAPLRRAA
jgi:CDP-paratose 2-epimerase